MRKKNIILIGMPGAGKSTIGVLLAKELGLDFIDTDVAIQVHEGSTLQQVVDRQGYLKLREIEERVILEQKIRGAVVATGGSAVYGAAAMDHLSSHGTVVFLNLPLQRIKKRIKNFQSRGIACQAGQGLEALYAERLPLYERYTDLDIPVDAHSADQVVAMILDRL